MRGPLHIACVVALLLGSAHRAHADDEDARTLFRKGTAQFALRNFDAASKLYERAFELHNDPKILYNAAQAHRLAGHKARALELYESLIRVYGEKFAARDEVNGHIRTLRDAIALEKKNAPPPPVVRVAPPSEPVVALVTPPPQKTPVTKKAWFWGVVGTSIAVVVGGVVAGVVLGTRGPPKPTFGEVPGN